MEHTPETLRAGNRDVFRTLLFICRYLMRRIAPKSDRHKRVEELFASFEHSGINFRTMGLPEHWQRHPICQNCPQKPLRQVAMMKQELAGGTAGGRRSENEGGGRGNAIWGWSPCFFSRLALAAPPMHRLCRIISLHLRESVLP